MTIVPKLTKPAPTPLSSVRNRTARTQLHELGTEYRRLQDQSRAIDKAKKDLIKDIEDICETIKVYHIDGGEFRVNRLTRKSVKLDKGKLLENGVTLAQIKKSTVSKTTSYYSVTAGDGDGDGDNNEES